MKYIITTLMVSLLLSITCNAQQVCPSEIPNEWQNSRYTTDIIDGDHVVTDEKTGLMWKRCAEGLSGVDCSVGTVVRYNWADALEVADIAVFASYDDWRVPNVKELNSIVAKNCHKPSINASVFPNTSNVRYICSTNRYVINFNYGIVNTSNATFPSNVRLVRTAN
jgi:hypothetical protein